VTEDKYFAALESIVASGALGLVEPGDREEFARLSEQAGSGDYEEVKATVTDEVVPGPHGPVPVRVYQPVEPGDARPLLVWCHGGGFVGGDLDMPEADAAAREVSSRANAVVVSVDYRLATHGVHFPVPHDDVVSAHRWAVSEASRLGASADRVTLGGASAGANLAAGACLRLRDEGDPPAALLLLYPAVHAELPTPSAELAEKLKVLSPMAAFDSPVFTPVMENYLGAPLSEAGGYAVPALCDLAGLPPTLVINCEYDGLRSSGEVFTASLEAAGVLVKQLLAPDVLHGHINSPWLPQAQQSYADMADWVGAAGR
jgi:acetyl esterase/lipase